MCSLNRLLRSQFRLCRACICSEGGVYFHVCLTVDQAPLFLAKWRAMKGEIIINLTARMCAGVFSNVVCHPGGVIINSIICVCVCVRVCGPPRQLGGAFLVPEPPDPQALTNSEELHLRRCSADKESSTAVETQTGPSTSPSGTIFSRNKAVCYRRNLISGRYRQ